MKEFTCPYCDRRDHAIKVLLAWVDERIAAEVTQRPDVNMHKITLKMKRRSYYWVRPYDRNVHTWLQVKRKLESMK